MQFLFFGGFSVLTLRYIMSLFVFIRTLYIVQYILHKNILFHMFVFFFLDAGEQAILIGRIMSREKLGIVQR